MNASTRRLAVLCSTATLATAGAAAGTPTAHAAPSHAHQARAGDGRVHMIIDTDIYSDVDDVGALAIANAAQDDGKVDLLGVMVDTPSMWGAPAVDAIDTYYGHGNVPIGSLKPNDDSTWSKNYTQYLAQHFPHSLKSGAGAPDAVRLYRKLLARQPDHSVTIAAIGYENNLAGLLDSGPDRYSPLSGYDLVARKVKLLTVMGGNWNFGHVSAPPPSRASVRAAAQRVVNDWPTRLVLNNSPGADVLTGSRLFTETPPTNPVREAYEIYVGYGNSRNSWDPANVFYDAFGTDGMLALTGDVGSDHVYPDGTNAWVASPDKDQNEVVRTASAATFGRALEDLMVQPPRHTPGAGRSSWLALQDLRVPPVAAATDDATTLRVDVHNPGPARATDVEVELQAPPEWAVTREATGERALAAGETSSSSWRLVAPPGLDPGSYDVRLTLSYRSGGHVQRVTRDAAVQVPYASLAAAFDNVGITDDADHAPGDFDGFGNSYSTQALARAGLAPGAAFTYDGIPFAWPDVPPGTPDNVDLNGQVVALSGSGTTLGVLGAAASGAHTGSGAIVYADGSEEPFDLTLTDWFSASPAGANRLAATTAYLNRTSPKPLTQVRVWYAAIPLRPGKPLAAIRLPEAPAHKMHVFAIGLR